MYQPELGEIHHPTHDQLLEAVQTYYFNVSHGVIGFVPRQILGPLAISSQSKGTYVDYCLDRGVMPYTRLLLGYDKDTRLVSPRSKGEDHPFFFPNLTIKAHNQAMNGLLIGGKHNFVEMIFSHYDPTNQDGLAAFVDQTLPNLLKKGYLLHHLTLAPRSYSISERAIEYGYEITVDRLALYNTQERNRPDEERLVKWFEDLKPKRTGTERLDAFLRDTPL